MYILVNDGIVERGKWTVDFEDRGYQFGDGIYEVVRVYNGRFFTLKEHLLRLEQSAQKIKLHLPTTLEKLMKQLQQLIEVEKILDGIVYIQVTRGVAPRVHYFHPEAKPVLIAYATPFTRPVYEMQHGIKAILCEDIRWLRCDIKSINLLGNVLAKQEAKQAGAYEAILHRNGVVTEGSSTNIWMCKNNVIYTHPATNLILNGITRQVVLAIAKDCNLAVQEQPFTIEQLYQADEVFLTSTTSEVMPIVQIGENTIGNGKPGPITRKLQDHFEHKIETIY